MIIYFSMGHRMSCIVDEKKFAVNIPLWGYSAKKRKWREVAKVDTIPENSSNDFRVLTYNVWFSNEYQPMRFQGLCNVLEKSEAQITGLQES